MNGLTKQRLQAVGQFLLLLVWIVALFHTTVYAQDTDAGEPLPTVAPAPAAEDLQAPTQVDVEPVAGDEAIAARLQNILVATEWFTLPTVSVRDGDDKQIQAQARGARTPEEGENLLAQA